MNSDRHCKNSRYRKYNLVCPYYNRESERGRSFQVRAIKLWNKILLDVRKKNTIALKKHFLNSVTKAWSILTHVHVHIFLSSPFLAF